MTKRAKQSFHRSKLKEQRLMRLQAKMKAKMKKRDNDDFFKLLTTESIDNLSQSEKEDILQNLYNLILSYPESNSDKLSLMLLFIKDNSINTITKACELLKDIFIEIIPSYRIIDTSSSKQKESKDVETLHNYERVLCHSYLEFIQNINVLDRTFYKNEQLNSFRQMLNEIISELFEKFYYFNHEEHLYKYLINHLTDELECIRKKAFESLYSVLAKNENSQNMFNLKLSIIKHFSNAVFSKEHTRFNKNVLELFIAHKLSFPDYKAINDNIDKQIDLSDLKYGGITDYKGLSKHESKKAKKDYAEFKKEKAKIVKSLKKELNEVEHKDNPKTIYYMNLKILKKILLVYFDLLKNKSESPLIYGVFSGISELCENINVEILLDLQKCIYELIKKLLLIQNNSNISLAIMGLKANLRIAQKLTKEIQSIQDSYLITSTYQILSSLCNCNDNINKDDISILFEVIEMILLKNRMFSIDVSSAFVKRLCCLGNTLKDDKAVCAVLLVIKRIFGKYSNLNYLLEDDGENVDMFNYKNTTEPELCNGKLTNVLNELNEVKQKAVSKGNKLMKKIVEYIIKGEKVNMELSSLNYYDVLLN